jgi:hypothetical protein
MRKVVRNMYDVLHELEDITMTVPSSLAKLYYGPWDVIKSKVSRRDCLSLSLGCSLSLESTSHCV